MQALARALFRRARVTLPALSSQGQARALAAVDGFLERPAPSSFVAAMRVLVDEDRARARERFALGTAGRAFEDGVAALGAAGLDDETVRALADRPAAPGVGARLRALAALVATRRELAGRAEAAVQALRAKMHARRLRS